MSTGNASFVRLTPMCRFGQRRMGHSSRSWENALVRVLHALGVDPVAVMVFGDAPNDMGLFGLCGYPATLQALGIIP